MSFHNDGIVCNGCNKMLLQAIPEMREWFQEKKRENVALHISCSFRTKEDQEDAFKRGASRAHWPNSAHNRTDAKGMPASWALDLFEMHNGRAFYPMGTFARLAEQVKKNGENIVWGGDFKNLGDACHFEFGGYSHRAA